MNTKIEYGIHDDEFIIKNYNRSKAFASFFPGIAGLWGKPMWIFYVNRGQAISCMGTKDKDGSMLEFLAANKAYRQTSLQGFRTFIKTDEKFYEPFLSNDKINSQQSMHITAHSLKLIEKCSSAGLKINVEYFTIPNENISCLGRILTIKNISKRSKKIECIDGLPMIMPYGSGDYLLKNMSRLAEGWFSGVEFSKKNKIPVYKLSVEPEDRPEILMIESGNFYAGFYYKSKGNAVLPEFIVDPDVVFGEMKDFISPCNFLNDKNFKNNRSLCAKNKTPSAFGFFKTNISPGKDFTYYSIIGNVLKVDDVEVFVKKAIKDGYLLNKKAENKNIIRDIGSKILTVSSDKGFDNYTQQTFLDNLLRGGYPVTLGKGGSKKNYYVYSRIHGDMEREYNNFVIMPEYFSQGNGNNRDVNQNRRNDVFFNPEIRDESIIYFMSLIQADGFNPLKISGSKFKVTNKNKFLELFKKEDRDNIRSFTASPFSLGNLFKFIEKEKNYPIKKNEIFLNELMSISDRIDYANHGEGYWSDHWHYNIGLIESYLAVYPEYLGNLLLKKKAFTFYDNPHVVMPRNEKHVLFKNNPRQFNSVVVNEKKEKMINDRKERPFVVRKNYGKGSIYKTTLIGKLLSIAANKIASLDANGVGVEMEGGKPNWCDALNGLPGLFGSSLAETLELKRLIKFIFDSFDKLKLDDDLEIKTAKEIIDFINDLDKAARSNLNNNFKLWDKTHDVKERYWGKTLFGFSGKDKTISVKMLKRVLSLFLMIVEKGINKAFNSKTGVISTNFQNEVTSYKIIRENGRNKENVNGLTCIKVKKFKQKPLPLFLEGPVHYLRVNENKDMALKFHNNVKKSGLYDKKLKMYKVNEFLKDVSINTGRIKIFTRGWLENESIWMHMEYKYIFELLRNNLSEEFYKEMKTVMVPFMDPGVYGRSIFENVSFIASSAHPEKEVHGQGFVSRLSGATAEFLSIWIAMTSGLKPFYLENGKLCLKFQPQLSKDMFTKKSVSVELSNGNKKENIIVAKNGFLFKFLGEIIVIYHNIKRKSTFGQGKSIVKRIKLSYINGKEVEINGDVIRSPYAADVRMKRIKRIDVILK